MTKLDEKLLTGKDMFLHNSTFSIKSLVCKYHYLKISCIFA